MDDSVPQTPTFQTVEPDKHRQLPWLAAILSLLVLTIIGALAYQNFILKKQLSLITPPPISDPPQLSPSTSPSQIDTSDWKTYTGQTMKYSFKYPSSWERPFHFGLLSESFYHDIKG